MKLFFCVLGFMATAMAIETTGIEKLFNDGNNVFTGKMFADVVKQEKDKSVVMSAFSVLTPLAQLSLGAVGDSHDQLLRTIGMPNDSVTKSAFPLVNGKLQAVKGITLKQASKIYLPLGFELQNEFQAISKEVFGSEVQNIDFPKNIEAAKEINIWVENQTNNRIKDLVSPDSLGPATRAILVNAIYFKGSWKSQFYPALTSDRDFHVTKTKTIQVPTMTQKGNFLYGESSELDAKLLQMAYVDGDTSLLVILPKEIEGISVLVEKLKDPSVIDKAVKIMYKADTYVNIPKFKIETTIDLKQTLSNIGLTSIFESHRAQLEKIIKSKEPLYVTEAVQKAFIEVNEEGAEAAAASVASAAQASAVPEAKNFTANHPFVFYLRHKDTVLFTGTFQS